jgi:hypothetical protein
MGGIRSTHGTMTNAYKTLIRKPGGRDKGKNVPVFFLTERTMP